MVIYFRGGSCLVDMQLLQKAILWYDPSKTPEDEVTVYRINGYAAVTLRGKQIQIHRLLMYYKYGMILPSNIFVHHKDGNKRNNLLDNLELKPKREHQRLPRTGQAYENILNGLAKRRGWSEEEKEKHRREKAM